LLRRPASLCLLVVFAGLTTALGPASGVAAPSPAPAWSIALHSYPTNLVPGSSAEVEGQPGFLVVATNIGAAATDGAFELSLTLPPGVEPNPAAAANGFYGATETKLSCEAIGNEVSCGGSGPVLEPGGIAQVNVPVKVSPAAPEAVTASAAVAGGGAATATLSAATTISAGLPAFSLLPIGESLGGPVTAADGSAATQAGSHPYAVRIGLGFPLRVEADESVGAVGGGVKDLYLDLPPGLVVNPRATAALCTEAQLETSGVGCPDAAQVGVFTLESAAARTLYASRFPLFNMVPPGGSALQLGTELTEGVFVHVEGGLRSDGTYGLSASIRDVPALVAIGGAEVTLWGSPTDPSHDYSRGPCLATGSACPVERSGVPLLTLPSRCGGLEVLSRADSWIRPDVLVERATPSAVIDGCNRLAYAPSLRVQLSSDLTDSPTGLGLELAFPQALSGTLAEAATRELRIELPQGLAISPGGADGPVGCGPAAIGLLTAPGQIPAGFDPSPPSCPNAAKVGGVEIATPLIGHPLRGSAYLAAPAENPFGSLFVLYLTVVDPSSGIVVKLAGKVEADPVDGQLTVIVPEFPQLPIEALRLSTFAGSRALLRTPSGCGSFVANSTLTPWSSPEGALARPAAAFELQRALSGDCRQAQPTRASFAAGAVSPRAGAYSPLLLQLSRQDGTQPFRRVEVSLPPGLSAALPAVATCADAPAAAGSCPADSRVGAVAIAAGPGPLPLQLQGDAYLAGPHAGAPLSLAIVVPAVAGPFDLGRVVVRVALRVDPSSAAVRAVSDPLPLIFAGVPLDVRSLSLTLDRARFTRNPTSCDPAAITAEMFSPGGSASLESRFQVGGCAGLGFRPKASVRLLGATHRGARPGLRAVVTPRPGDAALRRVAITLPSSELLASRSLGAVCTASEFEAGRCPVRSRHGRMTVWSPLTRSPLRGSMYLRASRNRLPDLVASLDGIVHVNLVARLDSVGGRLRATFRSLPDVPLNRAVIEIEGGRRGLLVNAGGFCREQPRSALQLLSHSGKARSLAPTVAGKCAHN
jgi:hypothetical protein